VGKSAIVSGADGLLIEVHKDPSKALSDGFQSLDFPMFSKLVTELKEICQVCGREI
jgi:3-deoxy-D-arabino-heptulosonate 7-phosphate (DAHP) synthase